MLLWLSFSDTGSDHLLTAAALPEYFGRENRRGDAVDGMHFKSDARALFGEYAVEITAVGPVFVLELANPQGDGAVIIIDTDIL